MTSRNLSACSGYTQEQENKDYSFTNIATIQGKGKTVEISRVRTYMSGPVLNNRFSFCFGHKIYIEK